MIQPKYAVPAPGPDATDLPAQLQEVTARYNRVLAENEDLRARLDRVERLLNNR